MTYVNNCRNLNTFDVDNILADGTLKFETLPTITDENCANLQVN